MQHVGGVVTTGIYCVDTCSARPKSSNVTMFTSAAAAEVAGFRACARCRPYRGDAPLGISSPEAVCCAVDLIARGAADEWSDDELARAVGVSARHLRRLFHDHLGVSPDQLARSRRAHLARRLLDDTDLTIAEITFAAGFGSVRQFNRVMLDVFRASPTRLRAARRATDRQCVDGGLVMQLLVPSTYDFEATAARLGRAAIGGVESISGTHVRRLVRIDDHPAVIEVVRRSATSLQVVAHLPRLEHLRHIVQGVRCLLGIDRHRTPPGAWDAVEAHLRASLPGPDGRDALAAIVRACGTPVPGLDLAELTHLFPTAAQLQALPRGEPPLTAAQRGALEAALHRLPEV